LKRVLLVLGLCMAAVLAWVATEQLRGKVAEPAGASGQVGAVSTATRTPLTAPSSTPTRGLPAPTDTTVPPTGTPVSLSGTPRRVTDTPQPTQPPQPPHTATPTTIANHTATPTRKPTARPSAKTTARPAPDAPGAPTPSVVNGHTYDVYLYAATKLHQYYHYTCEFDAAWVVFKSYGIDVTLDDQLAAIGVDTSVEPRYEETKQGIFVYGGDIGQMYSGDYKTNFLARSSGQAMRKVFEHFGLRATPVHDRASIEAALRRGELVWVKVTADFKPGKPVTWIKPDGTPFRADDGSVYKTVLGNDHAAVVMGYNKDVVVIRDVLGPTSTNAHRQYEYELSWDKFLTIWSSQSNDGLAVAKP
jgi:hypothetical protein